MARPTRSQRRARRQAQQRSSEGGAKPAPPRQRPTSLGSNQPAKTQGGGSPERGRGRFVRESIAELKKVDWPGQPQVMQATVVVLIACAVVGAWLFVADTAARRIVNFLIGA